MLRFFCIIGTFITCMKNCNNDAKDLIYLITTEFRCYQDEVIYHGKKGNCYYIIYSVNFKRDIL